MIYLLYGYVAICLFLLLATLPDWGYLRDRIALERAFMEGKPHPHDKGCRDMSRKALKGHHRFFRRWPKACRTCDGEGGASSPGYFNPFSGACEDPSFTECPDCLAISQCPRCGNQLDDTWFDSLSGSLTPCPHCNWEHGTTPDDSAGYNPVQEVVLGFCCQPEDVITYVTKFPTG